MTLQSMTGFSRVEGTSGRTRWAWELRSVNGKGLDLRLRLPPGLEALEADVRRLAGEAFSRGNLQIGLATSVSEAQVEAVVNQGALSAVLALRDQLNAVPALWDGFTRYPGSPYAQSARVYGIWRRFSVRPENKKYAIADIELEET